MLVRGVRGSPGGVVESGTTPASAGTCASPPPVSPPDASTGTSSTSSNDAGADSCGAATSTAASAVGAAFATAAAVSRKLCVLGGVRSFDTLEPFYCTDPGFPSRHEYHALMLLPPPGEMHSLPPTAAANPPAPPPAPGAGTAASGGGVGSGAPQPPSVPAAPSPAPTPAPTQERAPAEPAESSEAVAVASEPAAVVSQPAAVASEPAAAASEPAAVASSEPVAVPSEPASSEPAAVGTDPAPVTEFVSEPVVESELAPVSAPEPAAVANSPPTTEAVVDVAAGDAAPQESTSASSSEALDVPVDASGGDNGGGDAEVPAESGAAPDSTTPPEDPRTPLTNMLRSWIARRPETLALETVQSAIQSGLSPEDQQTAPETLLEMALLCNPSRVRSWDGQFHRAASHVLTCVGWRRHCLTPSIACTCVWLCGCVGGRCDTTLQVQGVMLMVRGGREVTLG